MKRWSTYFKLLIVICSTVFVWYHMIYSADTNPSFFNDEIANTQAAVSFFSTGDYKNDRYGFAYSSGIAVTWPSAVGWHVGHNLLASRISCAFFTWLIALGLGFCFFRRSKYRPLDSFAAAVFLWAAMITPPFAMPYWHGFIYNLGELNTVLLIGFGLLCLAQQPMIAVFIFGVAVWHGKLIYLPFIIAILSGDLLSRVLSKQETLKAVMVYGIVFSSPLILWVAWLCRRGDVLVLEEWFRGQYDWFTHMMSLHHRVATPGVPAEGSFFGRLSSPRLEWAGYSLGTKIKDLLFSIGAISFVWMSLIRLKNAGLKVGNRAFWISILLTVCVGFHTAYYFFFHPSMWQRHFHPSLYVGFGLIVFWGTQWSKKLAPQAKVYACIAVCLLVLVQGKIVLSHPLLSREISYARFCTDLYSSACDPTLYP